MAIAYNLKRLLNLELWSKKPGLDLFSNLMGLKIGPHAIYRGGPPGSGTYHRLPETPIAANTYATIFLFLKRIQVVLKQTAVVKHLNNHYSYNFI